MPEFHCPKCNKNVPESEVMPLVTAVMTDGSEIINRAAHWPGCAQELEII